MRESYAPPGLSEFRNVNPGLTAGATLFRPLRGLPQFLDECNVTIRQLARAEFDCEALVQGVA